MNEMDHKKIKQETINIFTDGSCLGNGKKGATGGIGVFFGDNDPRNISTPYLFDPPTNNKCELFACIRAIQQHILYRKINRITIKQRVVIHSDSKYMINLITSWINEWKKNGWKTKTNKDVKNKNLIVWLDTLINNYSNIINIEFIHVKAHKKEPDKNDPNHWIWYGNMMADKFARQKKSDHE